MASRSAFAKLLKIFREEKGISQADLRRKLETFGYTVDVTTLSRYESGERRPSASFIPFFAGSLGLSLDDERALLVSYLEDFQASALEEYKEGKANVGIHPIE